MSKPTETEIAPEGQRVVWFKMEWLLHAGYSPDNAERLASTPEVDWHLAVDILPLAQAKGVDEETVVKIFL